MNSSQIWERYSSFSPRTSQHGGNFPALSLVASSHVTVADVFPSSVPLTTGLIFVLSLQTVARENAENVCAGLRGKYWGCLEEC